MEPWFELYASAVLEWEPECTIERVDGADAAIPARLRYLQYDGDHHEERQLMKDAERTLSFCTPRTKLSIMRGSNKNGAAGHPGGMPRMWRKPLRSPGKSVARRRSKNGTPSH